MYRAAVRVDERIPVLHSHTADILVLVVIRKVELDNNITSRAASDLHLKSERSDAIRRSVAIHWRAWTVVRLVSIIVDEFY